jgi:hypothetical protein
VARLPVSRFTAVVVVVAALFVVPLLTLTDHDPSYSCRAGALMDVLHPEPEQSAAFRAEVGFDSGHACNRAARSQVAAAVCIIAVGGLVIAVQHRRRRQP